MEIRFENKRGEVRFLGGSNQGDWHIIDVDGLGLLTLNTQTVTYYGENGQETVNKTLPSRTITLTVEVKARNRDERSAIVSRALRVLAYQGVLSIRTFRERVVDCYVKTMSNGQRNGNFRTYVFQFVCDSPYFRDRKATEIPLFKRKDLIRDGFVIGDGVILTQRMVGSTITNNSDEKCEGIMTLATGSYNGEINVVNKTTGAMLKFYVESGKKYTVDLERRTITDEYGEDCIDILDEESYMSDFYLNEGINEIEVTSDEGVGLNSIFYTFNKKYVEATD